MAYQNLLVWKESHRLSLMIYAVTSTFPNAERYGLVSQMRRATVSIASNLAEGSGRSGKNEMRHFCSIAIGSASELEYQLMLAKDLAYVSIEQFNPVYEQVRSVLRLLNCFIKSLREDL